MQIKLGTHKIASFSAIQSNVDFLHKHDKNNLSETKQIHDIVNEGEHYYKKLICKKVAILRKIFCENVANQTKIFVNHIPKIQSLHA